MANVHATAVLALALSSGSTDFATSPATPRPPRVCTGVSLAAADGTQVVGRTVEWALGEAGHDRGCRGVAVP
ncbi:MAG: hypothetical protein ACK501_11835 [Planctomycetota bacterium]|jgi:penicillin V acylase-like amidase (Ntn superfamily)